jgi:hypothetical protein
VNTGTDEDRELMRHSSERITSDIYASVLPELKAEVSAALAATISHKNDGKTVAGN